MTPIDWLITVGSACVVVWLLFGMWTAIVATRRGGRGLHWVFIGVFLGPLGPLVVLKVLTHHCPSCQAKVLRAVSECPNCGREVPRMAENPDGPLWTYRRNW